MKYDPKIVTAWFNEVGIPEPVYEHRFHPVRKWRMDLAWIEQKVYLEIDGGIWIRGGHNRGAQMKKDWEKLNTASGMGWRLLKCEPKDLCTMAVAEFIKEALELKNNASLNINGGIK